MAGRHILSEVGSVFAGVCAATWVAGRAPEPLAEYANLALAAVFLVTSLRMARRRPGGTEAYGISLGGLLAAPDDAPDAGSWAELGRTLRRGVPAALRELAWALTLAALIFPPYVWGFAYVHDARSPFRLVWPPHTADFVLGQVIVVALPEEALFRGYFQSRLAELWPARRTWLGATLSAPAWLVQAALFGAIHVLSGGGPARLATFFPGLLFGWLRTRRGGIGAAVFLHALSNLCAELLHRGWF